MVSLTEWGLAIDFGTSFTATAVVHDGTVEMVEVEDDVRFPSWVLASEDGFVVGRAALTHARRSPERFERSPKRLVGQKAALLGDEAVAVVDLVASVLGRAFAAACTRQGDTAPAWVRLTHPAIWQQERLDVLRAAARQAGLGECELMSEPEAAAWFFVNDRRGNEPVVDEGQSIAMYDLGGGTFDTAILRRDEDGFSLAGQPGGDDWFGGEDFDQRLLDHVLRQMKDRDAGAARQLAHPLNAHWQRARLQLQRDVRDAKEALSSTARVSVPVTAESDVIDIEITRGEFEDLIREDLQRTVAVMESTIHRAGLERDEIAAIYLTGGSSRIPLAAALLSQFHPHTYTRPDPKTVVVQGAASVGTGTGLTPKRVEERAESVTIVREPERKPGPPPATTPSDRRRSPARTLAVVALLLGAAVVIGVVTVAGSGSDEPAGLAASSSSSSLRLSHPAGWSRASSSAETPGLRLTDPVSVAPTTAPKGARIVAGLTKAHGPLLLPEEFALRLGKTPSRDDRVRLGDLQAYRYRSLTPRGSGSTVTVFASPTTKGVVTISCYHAAPADKELDHQCEQIAGSVELQGGEPYPLGPDANYARVVSGVVKALNRRRTSGRSRLRRAKTPKGQATAATTLQGTHRTAASALAKAKASPLDAAADTKLLSALRSASAGYAAMAAAARRRGRAAFSAAAKRVRRADVAVREALTELQRNGYRVR